MKNHPVHNKLIIAFVSMIVAATMIALLLLIQNSSLYHSLTYSGLRIKNLERQISLAKANQTNDASADTIPDTFLKETVVEESKYSDHVSAMIKKIAGVNYVVIKQDDHETIIDLASTTYDSEHSNMSDVLQFKNISFSSSGKYITYTAWGWEWATTRVYDIAQHKKIVVINSGITGFSTNDSYFFACTNDDASGEYFAKVFSLPDGKEKTDLLSLVKTVATPYQTGCTINDKNELVATVTLNPQEEDCTAADANQASCKTTKTIIYNFDTDRATVK